MNEKMNVCANCGKTKNIVIIVQLVLLISCIIVASCIITTSCIMYSSWEGGASYTFDWETLPLFKLTEQKGNTTTIQVNET
jgi:hypothetical protein